MYKSENPIEYSRRQAILGTISCLVLIAIFPYVIEVSLSDPNRFYARAMVWIIDPLIPRAMTSQFVLLNILFLFIMGSYRLLFVVMTYFYFTNRTNFTVLSFTGFLIHFPTIIVTLLTLAHFDRIFPVPLGVLVVLTFLQIKNR